MHGDRYASSNADGPRGQVQRDRVGLSAIVRVFIYPSFESLFFSSSQNSRKKITGVFAYDAPGVANQNI